MGCCIDVGLRFVPARMWCRQSAKQARRLFNVHMKDLTNFQSKESQVAVGDGMMPVRKYLKR